MLLNKPNLIQLKTIVESIFSMNVLRRMSTSLWLLCYCGTILDHVSKSCFFDKVNDK